MSESSERRSKKTSRRQRVEQDDVDEDFDHEEYQQDSNIQKPQQQEEEKQQLGFSINTSKAKKQQQQFQMQQQQQHQHQHQHQTKQQRFQHQEEQYEDVNNNNNNNKKEKASSSSLVTKNKYEHQKQEQQQKRNQQQQQQLEEDEEEQSNSATTSNNNNVNNDNDDNDDNNNNNNKNSNKFRLRRIAANSKTEKDYDKLNLNPLIVRSLKEKFTFEKLTDIQGHCIPQALAGRDILAEAKTGSGKTIAFLVPIVEILTRAGFRHQNGTGAIIIGPTRELCQQIEGVLLKLVSCFNGSITFLCCIGGVNRKNEAYKLAQGQQIVVSSPGRLLDHLKLTTQWHTKNLLILTVDEADRVLDNGFEEDIREIVSLLPKQRQTFLFSATQTTRVEQLARVSLRGEPVFISLKKKDEEATVDTLEQGYVMCPSELRFLLLYKFLKQNIKKKIIVFFSSRNSVSFHYELFNYIDLPCVAFHGKQKQHQRSATYMQFCNASGGGIMLTTDVAARGLDIPAVDWIVQYDPPDDPTRYIHRVGRTARAGSCGQSILFLLPSEKKFLSYLREDANVTVSEFVFDLDKITQSMQDQFQQLVTSNYYLRTSAKNAFEGYLLAYSASQLKNVYDIHSLDLARVARGVGLSEPPPIRIDLSESAARLNKRERKDFKNKQSQQNYSADQNYNNQNNRGRGRGGGSGGGRQFSR